MASTIISHMQQLLPLQTHPSALLPHDDDTRGAKAICKKKQTQIHLFAVSTFPAKQSACFLRCRLNKPAASAENKSSGVFPSGRWC